MLYFFLRIFAVPLFLCCYILYQLLVKKKKFATLKTDVFYAILFTLAYFGLYYFVTS